MIARSIAVIPITPAASLLGLEGYFVLPSGAVVTSATAAAPYGVVTEGFDVGNFKSSVAVAAFGGTVKVKLSATPGSVVAGSYLVLDGTTLGAVKLDPGTGARIQVARAVESGAAGELIEAFLINPVILSA